MELIPRIKMSGLRTHGFENEMDLARWLCPKAGAIHNNSTLNTRALYLPPTRYWMLFLLLTSILLRLLRGFLLIIYTVDEYVALLFIDQLTIFLSNLYASPNHFFFLLSSVCAAVEFVNFLWTLKALNFSCYLNWNDFINSIFFIIHWTLLLSICFTINIAFFTWRCLAHRKFLLKIL